MHCHLFDGTRLPFASKNAANELVLSDLPALNGGRLLEHWFMQPTDRSDRSWVEQTLEITVITGCKPSSGHIPVTPRDDLVPPASPFPLSSK